MSSSVGHLRRTTLLPLRKIIELKKKPPSEFPAPQRKRKRLAGVDRPSLGESLNSLKALRCSLGNVRSYRPPDDFQRKVHTVLASSSASLGESLDWEKKFSLLQKFIAVFDHDVPSYMMNRMETVDDVIEYFRTPVKETNTLQEMRQRQDSLPPNLSVSTKTGRFAETQAETGQTTAFPESDTIVFGLKYRRKYADYKAPVKHKFLADD